MYKSVKTDEEIKFPQSENIRLFIQTKLQEHNEKRAKKPETLTEEDMDKLLEQIAIYSQSTLDILAKNIPDKAEKLKEAIKAVNDGHRAANRIKKHSTFGKCVEQLIQFICFSIIKRLKQDALINPEQVKRILRGEVRTFNFESCTKTMADKTKTNTNSFTGTSGFYTAMLELGFVIKKENYGPKFPKSKYGSLVRLTIDLDWVFGYSLKLLQGNSMKQLSNILVKTGQSPLSGVQNHQIKKDFDGSAQGSQPTPSETNLGKGEISTSPTNKKTENWERFSAPAAPAPSIPSDVIQHGKDLWQQCKNEIYTPENIGNQRIRLNQVTVLTGLNPNLEQDALALMIENIVQLHEAGEAWTDTKARISVAIARLGKYMGKHPKFYQYAPLMWLDPKMNDRTLKAYHDRYLKPKPKADPLSIKPNNGVQNVDNQAVSDSDIETEGSAAPVMEVAMEVVKIPKPKPTEYDFISWFKEMGADPYRVNRLVRKRGSEFIADCIRLGKAKVGRNFDPDNGIVPYIFGIIGSGRHELVIKKSADAEEILLSQGITLQMERKARRKGGKNEPNDTEQPKTLWYAGRIEAIRKEILPKFTIPNDALYALIARANDRKASSEQVAVWLEGLSKGTLKL